MTGKKTWGEMVEEELGTEIVPGQVLGWSRPATPVEGNADSGNISDQTNGNTGQGDLEGADTDDAGKGVASGAETPRSAFSDSSSGGEDGVADAEEGPNSRPANANALVLSGSDSDVEPAREQYEEDTPMPDVPPSALHNPNNINIDPAIICVAENRLFPSAMQNGAMLPISGTGDYPDADIVKNHYESLRIGQPLITPVPLTKSVDEGVLVLHVSHQKRIKARKEIQDKTTSEPTLFKAHANDKAYIERLQNHRDVRQKELERVSGELEKTIKQLKDARHWLDRSNKSVDDLQATKATLREDVSKAQAELVQRTAEVQAWKTAFERQKPIVAKSRQWDAEKLDAETQTEVEEQAGATRELGTNSGSANVGAQTPSDMERDVRPVTQVSGQGVQMASGEGVSLSFAPLTYLELLPSSRRSRQTSSNFLSFESLLDDNSRLQRESADLKTTNDKMKNSVRELKRKYEELEQANADLRAQVEGELALQSTIQEQPDELAGRQLTAAGVTTADLERFMEHGRDFKAACDRYHEDLSAAQRKVDQLEKDHAKLLIETGEARSKLAASEAKVSRERAKWAQLQHEHMQLEVKYRCLRGWAKARQDPEFASQLPSPCTPFSSPVVQRRPTADFERRRIAELRCAGAAPAARSIGSIRRVVSARGITVEVGLNLQGIDGFLWFLCIVVVLLMAQSAPGVLNEWMVPKH